MVNRYCGKEFRMLLRGAGPGAAIAQAERLRVAVAGDAEAEAPFPITVSIRVATATGESWGTGVPALLADAERALYAAKGGAIVWSAAKRLLRGKQSPDPAAGPHARVRRQHALG